MDSVKMKRDYKNTIYVFFALLIAFTYYKLHLIYRPYFIDDGWILARVYNYYVNGIERDVVFGSSVTLGIGTFEMRIFGKIFSYIYGFILDILGWNKSNSHCISIVFLLFTAIVWLRIIIHLGFTSCAAISFSLTMLYTEVFFGVANGSRPEAFILFLSSLSLYYALKQGYFKSILLAMIALETHPVGAISFFWVLATFADQKNRLYVKKQAKRVIIHSFFGLVLGLLIYLSLHYKHVHLLSEMPRGVGSLMQPKYNFLYVHFFMTKYLRHLPELILITGVLVFYIAKGYYRQTPFIFALITAMIMYIIVINRPNPQYAVLVYPPFLLLLIWMAEHIKRLTAFTVLVILFFTPQYMFVFHKNSQFKSFDNYLNRIEQSVPNDKKSVVGSANDWFAFKKRNFYSLCYIERIPSILNDFYLIEHSLYFENYHYNYETTCSNITYMNEAFSKDPITQFDYNNDVITVSYLKKKVGN